MLAAILALFCLLNAFVMYCCCVVAGRADRAEERLYEQHAVQDRAHNKNAAEDLCLRLSAAVLYFDYGFIRPPAALRAPQCARRRRRASSRR